MATDANSGSDTMSDNLIAAGVLAVGVALCFRIAWEEWRWPMKMPAQGMEARQGRDEGSVEDDSPTRRDAPDPSPNPTGGVPSAFDEALDYIRPHRFTNRTAPVILKAGMLRCCVSAILMREADLLSRLTAAEAERDEALREHTDMMWQRRRADERADAAEAERDRLRTDLEAARVREERVEGLLKRTTDAALRMSAVLARDASRAALADPARDDVGEEG